MEFQCKICGGNLKIKENSKVVTCEYCGTAQTLPKLENDKTANLYDRANHFRRNNQYDKAEALYEMILNEDSKDAEAYWSLILCKYGIDYVEDPKTHEYIPTCNRTQSSSIFSDNDYKQALKYASTEQKELYEKEAEKINNIQKGILEISNKEEAFDVFICYKETDEKNQRTKDSVIAQELYYNLEKEGLRTFFSKITLEDKIGQNYEPYIYAALKSAKVMIVIGTNKEYFEAPWVKNEWSRYLTLIKNGEEKTLIPCFKDISAYDLPEEFAHLQAQDMSKVGFEQDLIYGIKKISNTKPKKVNKTLLLSTITMIVIAIILSIVYFKIISVEEQKDIAQNEETIKILREDISATSGYTFNITVEELKNKIMEKVSETSDLEGVEAKTISMAEDYLGIGWFYQSDGSVVGIEIYNSNGGEYVTGISCTPAQYGSGDVGALSVPVNLYNEAKKILGSDTKEWQELCDKGMLIEKTSDYFTGEEITNGDFYAGMRKNLYIVSE